MEAFKSCHGKEPPARGGFGEGGVTGEEEFSWWGGKRVGAAGRGRSGAGSEKVSRALCSVLGGAGCSRGCTGELVPGHPGLNCQAVRLNFTLTAKSRGEMRLESVSQKTCWLLSDQSLFHNLIRSQSEV